MIRYLPLLLLFACSPELPQSPLPEPSPILEEHHGTVDSCETDLSLGLHAKASIAKYSDGTAYLAIRIASDDSQTWQTYFRSQDGYYNTTQTELSQGSLTLEAYGTAWALSGDGVEGNGKFYTYTCTQVETR